MIRLYAHGVVSSLANGRIIQMFRAVASGSALPWRRQLARLRSHPRMALPQLSRVSHGDKLASIPRPISWIRLRCSCGSDASLTPFMRDLLCAIAAAKVGSEKRKKRKVRERTVDNRSTLALDPRSMCLSLFSLNDLFFFFFFEKQNILLILLHCLLYE